MRENHALDVIERAAHGVEFADKFAPVAEESRVDHGHSVRSVDEVDGNNVIADATLTELARKLTASTNLIDIADAFPAVGKQRPAAFHLVMMPGTGVPVAAREFGVAASEPILRIAKTLVAEDDALDPARTLTAWVFGRDRIIEAITATSRQLSRSQCLPSCVDGPRGFLTRGHV